MSRPVALRIIRHLRNGGDPTLTNDEFAELFGCSNRSVTNGLTYAYGHGLLAERTERLPEGRGTRRHLSLTASAETARKRAEGVTA